VRSSRCYETLGDSAERVAYLIRIVTVANHGTDLVKFKYAIVAGDYHELSGGHVALHQLCDILREIGEEAYVCDFATSSEASPAIRFGSMGATIKAWFRWHYRHQFIRLRTSDKLCTPVLRSPACIRNDASWIVVYPEIVYGNPYKARHVVRWLMHQPGYFTGKVGYGTNELHFRYSDWIKDLSIERTRTSKTVLRVFRIPPDYKRAPDTEARKGTAVCLRKGRNRPLNAHPSDAIIIDGMSHAETAKVLRSVDRLICYDMYTAYSGFALLCGCESLVVPDTNIPEDIWIPNEEERWGVAYGENRVDWAKRTTPLQIQRLQAMERETTVSVQAFVDECEQFFSH
jgi:hypothetical protein